MLTNLSLTQTQRSIQRRRHEQRAEHAHQNTHKQRQGQVLQSTRTQDERTNEQDRAHRQNTHNSGVNRTDQSLVHRQVNLLGKGRVAALKHAVRVLANLIEHHHRVVQRVAQNRQETNNRTRSNLEAERGVQANRHHHGEEQTRNRRQRHLPGTEVKRHTNQRKHHKRDQTPERLTGHIRTPGRAHKRGGHVILRDAVRLLQSRLHLQSLIIAELAHLGTNRTRRNIGHANIRSVLRLLVNNALTRSSINVRSLRDHELRTATEINTQVEAATNSRNQNRNRHQHSRKQQPQAALTHEGVRAGTRMQVITEAGKSIRFHIGSHA